VQNSLRPQQVHIASYCRYKIKSEFKAPTGYSGKPLAKKLGIKEGFKIRLVNQPTYYFDLFTDMPENVTILRDKKSSKNLVHYFTKENSDLQSEVIASRNEIYPNGMICISWPKKTAKIETGVTGGVIRSIPRSN
jgi:hypothetical protein